MENLTVEMQHTIISSTSLKTYNARVYTLENPNSHDHMPSPHPTYTTPLESLSLVYYQYIQQQCLEKEREDINLVFSLLSC